MTEPKITYKSKNVVVATGNSQGVADAAAEATGNSPESTHQMLGFASSIILAAQRLGLNPGQCYTAALNVMVEIMNMQEDPAARAELVSVTTEALCAVAGGGSDSGVKG